MKISFLLLFCLLYSSCHLIKDNDNLDNSDLGYLEELGLFSKNEKIIWFESQLDKKTSGNFLTDKKVASYWIDNYDSSKSYKHFFLLEDIDSLQLFDLSKSATMASYIKVYSNGKSMKLYIDKDSAVLNNYLKEIELAIKK